MHVVTQRDYDQRDNANREAIANVKAAEATLQTAKLNLDYTEVRAPVDGRVGRIEVTVGQSRRRRHLVAGADVAGLRQSDLCELRCRRGGRAARADARSPSRRASAAISTRSRSRWTTSGGSAAKGHIQLIDNQVNGQSGTIRVRAVFYNDDGRLIPGQFARVRMGQPQQQTLVMVDERAIGTDQDKKFVMVVGADNRAAYRAVTLGGCGRWACASSHRA